MNPKITLAIIFTILFSGCNDPDYTLEFDQKIVVDGWIMNGQKPQVILTLSSPYFSTFDSVSVRDLALTRAKVTVSSDAGDDILVLSPSDSYFPPYVYQSLLMTGNAGKSYSLRIDYQGKSLFASTYIPFTPLFDSVWFQPENAPSDTMGHLEIKLTDRVDSKEYYRILTRRVGKDGEFKPAMVSMIDDKLFGGNSGMTLPVYNGKGSNLDPDDEVYFNRKDIIQIRVMSVDRETYDFWVTANAEVNNTGNPLASSRTGIKTNIEGGLGLFGGYAHITRTLYPSDD